MLVHNGLRIVHNDVDDEEEAPKEAAADSAKPPAGNGKEEAPLEEPSVVDRVMRDVGNVTADTQACISGCL